MTAILEVFEKYKHLDELLSDKTWLPEEFIGSIIYDLWQAIKDDQLVVVETEEPEEKLIAEW